MSASDQSETNRKPTVVAFGETLVDQFSDRAVLGGAPFNVSCHLAALGVHPVLVTRAGKDAAGDMLQQAMGVRGLDPRGVQSDPVRPTGRVKVTETDDGHRFDILPDQAYDHIHAGLARMVGLSAHPELVYFGTLSQRSEESRRALRDLLGAVTACAFLDLNLRDPWVDADTVRWSLTRASVAKLNEDELLRVGQLLGLDGDTPAALAAVLRSTFDLQQVVVTAGPAGAWALDPAGRLEAVPGTPLRQIVDTVGAGDGFAAVAMLGMLRGWSTADTLARADAFARALCGIRGAVPASQAFYAPFRRDWQIETEASHA
jgi:fructokinase